MPCLPSNRNPLLVAHLYTDDSLNETKDSNSLQKEVCYVAEDDVYVEREKKCTASVSLRGIDELTCSLNVEEFMKRGSECQWIQFLIYVDDRLLDELCRDFKYTRQDIERSAGEILSPTFKLKQTTGNIIFVIKTHGPGKKWPDYNFTFNYSRTPYDQLAALMPATFAHPESRRFRDVEKKAEVLVDKFKELQYIAEDQILQEKLLEEAARKVPVETTEVVETLSYNEDVPQGRKRRPEIIRVTPEPDAPEKSQIVFTFNEEYGEESRRRLSFENRWNALCEEVGVRPSMFSQTSNTPCSTVRLSSGWQQDSVEGEKWSMSSSRPTRNNIEPEPWYPQQASFEVETQNDSFGSSSTLISALPPEIKPLPVPKMRNMTIVTRSFRRRK